MQTQTQYVLIVDGEGGIVFGPYSSDTEARNDQAQLHKEMNARVAELHAGGAAAIGSHVAAYNAQRAQRS